MSLFETLIAHQFSAFAYGLFFLPSAFPFLILVSLFHFSIFILT